MDNITKKLVEAGLLSEADQTALQESFNARVQAAQEQAVMQVRAEMADRFEHDKNVMLEAADKALTDVVQKYETDRLAERAELKRAYRARIQDHAKVLESFVMSKLGEELKEFHEDRKAVSDLRTKLTTVIAENKQTNNKRFKESMTSMKTFVLEQLSGEIQKLRSQQMALVESRQKLEQKYSQARDKINESYETRIAEIEAFVTEKLANELSEFQADKRALVTERANLVNRAMIAQRNMQESFDAKVTAIDEFVKTKIAEELSEFQADKKALVEKRVELVKHARRKLAETQRDFVTKAAKMVDAKVTSALKRELSQLHEDLERNRQNMLGRRIFEAVAAEFQSSYFAEGTETRRLEKALAEQAEVLESTKKQLSEAKQATEAASRKTRLAEEAAVRAKTMSELLSPLTRDKQTVMQELLGTVKTTQLREAFTKYLPAVLNEGGLKKTPQVSRTLTEAPKESSTVTITGNQRVNRLLETVQAENTEAVSTETAAILKLAGITK